MPLSTRVETHGFNLTPVDERRIEHGLHALERRLSKRPDPSAILVLTHFPARRVVEADLRVQLGPLGAHLIARETAETADHATRRAIEEVERQLERRVAIQRGEPTYGVPSRRRATPSRPRQSQGMGEVSPEDTEAEEADEEI
jgi:ribosome-associated translation inhibitor RaiA